MTGTSLRSAAALRSPLCGSGLAAMLPRLSSPGPALAEPLCSYPLRLSNRHHPGAPHPDDKSSIWNLAKTRYRVMCTRYRYIVILYPISGPIFCDTISGHIRYWVTRYRVIPDIRYTRYLVCPDIGTDIHDQDIPVSGPHVPISCQ